MADHLIMVVEDILDRAKASEAEREFLWGMIDLDNSRAQANQAKALRDAALDLIALIDNNHNKGLSGFYLQRERFVALRKALAPA